MKRRREIMEKKKKRSEMTSLIDDLSNFIVKLDKKPHQDHLIATVSQQNDDQENSITVSINHIPIKPFLSVCNFLLQVLDKIGPTMVVLRRDVHTNIQRLEKLYETDPGLYSNVVEMLKKEAKENCARKNGSCSKAFLWLTRALDFGVSLLEAIVRDCDLNMEEAVEESYNATLKQWHGWISSAAYKVALKLVPENKTLITILTDQDEENETFKQVQTLVSLLTPVLQDIHSILIQYELDKMKSS